MSCPVVVGLGKVEPQLVSGVLGDGIDFVAEPTESELATAVGAIVRADAVVDTPRMGVLARTGVGADLVDLQVATARGIVVVVTPAAATDGGTISIIGYGRSGRRVGELAAAFGMWSVPKR